MYCGRNERSYGRNRKRLYRSRNGQFLGLCQGIADWRDLPVFYIRLGFILAAVFTAFLPVLIVYIILSLILETEPRGNEEEFQNFNSRYKENKEDVMDGIKREFREAKDRVSRMESEVVDKEKDWDKRFNQEL